MTGTTLKKTSVAFGLLSFVILAIGSMINGTRMVTAVIRGTEAAVFFGFLAWGLGYLLVGVKEEEDKTPTPDGEEDPKGGGEKIDKTV